MSSADEPAEPGPRSGEPAAAAGWGIAAGLSLAFVGSLDLTTPAVIIGAVVAVADLALLVSRWKSLAAAEVMGVARDGSYGIGMALVTLALQALSMAPVIASKLSIDAQIDCESWPLRGAAIAAAVTTATIHVSSLVDWAFIRPRLVGMLGIATLPCQQGRGDAYPEGVPKADWRLLTRIWLTHRLIAHVVVRLGIAAMIVFGIASLVAGSIELTSVQLKEWQPVLAATASILAAVVVVFVNRFLPVWSLVLTPRLNVGDRIVLAEEFGTGVAQRPIYYVVDIAVEGIKLLQLDEFGVPRGAAGADPKREHDRSLPLVDIPRLLRSRGRFTGCDHVCSRAHHLCPLKFRRRLLPGEDA